MTDDKTRMFGRRVLRKHVLWAGSSDTNHKVKFNYREAASFRRAASPWDFGFHLAFLIWILKFNMHPFTLIIREHWPPEAIIKRNRF